MKEVWNMKIQHLYTQLKYLMLVLLTIGAVSCTDENIVDDRAGSTEPITVKLGFSAEAISSVISSRSPNDNTVGDLYILIFDASGNLKAKRYFDSDELTDGVNGSQPDTQGDNNWVKMSTAAGASYIYGVANIGTETTPQYTSSIKSLLDEVNSKDGFLSLSANLTEDITRVGTTYVMAGAVNGGEAYNITAGQSIKTLKLRRLDSHIMFKFKKAGNCSDLSISSYQVFNVPKVTHLMQLDSEQKVGTDCTWDAAKREADFYNTGIISDKVSIDNSFSFYMVENRKNANKNIPDNDYGLREKQEKIPIAGADTRPVVENGDYVYAPKYGTYVVVTGKFKGTSTVEGEGNSGAVEADVRYTIHLGYVGNRANDFFSNRNTQYTYNVTVKGVNDIVVEVIKETETENASGAEGDVIFTEGTTKYKLDAHYETVLLKFNKELLKQGAQRAGEFFTYKIETPFTRLGAKQENDNSWIRIVRNSKTNGIYSTKLKRYPARDYLTIEGFIAELKEIATDESGKYDDYYDRNGDIVYTCHIDEFYYDSAPNGARVNSSVPLWKYFVNDAAGRELQILNDVRLSPDGKSSITRSTYILSQRAIQTFYNPNPNLIALKSAYGVESVDETGPLRTWHVYPSEIGIYPTDKDTGRDNFLAMLRNIKGEDCDNYLDWSVNGYTEVDETAKIIAMKGQYKRAFLACLQRNRDIDGSGKLEDNEIKWYLPAINQYAGMFLGDAGLSDEAKLYTDKTYIYKHFISSTAKTYNERERKKNLIVYWGEESVSTSCNTEYGMTTTVVENKDTYVLNYYRCMRNLGTGTPQNFYSISTNTKTITVPYLNEEAYRTRVEQGELGRHFSWDDESKLSSGGFQYGEEGKTRVTSNLREAMPYDESAQNYNSACYDVRGNKSFWGGYEWAKGTWRAPNLRELYLLSIASGVLKSDDVARTIFQFHDVRKPNDKGTGNYRRGWFYNGSDITMGNGYIGQYEDDNKWHDSEGNHIRCVRDVK